MYITGNTDGLPRSLDIVLGCDECLVHVGSSENEVGHESMEFWGETKTYWRTWICSQTLAHITVFSFLRKQRHLICNLDYFLFPSIAATNDEKEIRIYVYDSKHDILLESREMNLFIEILGTKSQPLSYEAILAVWLVVNYRLLCNGPQSLLQVPKASFM